MIRVTRHSPDAQTPEKCIERFETSSDSVSVVEEDRESTDCGGDEKNSPENPSVACAVQGIKSRPHESRLHGHHFILTEKSFNLNQGLDNGYWALRRFDLDMRFGPFVGIDRVTRWERAARAGLSPPLCIRDIIMKQK